MKLLKYQFVSEVNHGTEENPQIEQILHPCEIRTDDEHLEENLAIAKEEAYNGEYIIEDDGQPEPVAEPTADEILNAMLGVNRYA